MKKPNDPVKHARLMKKIVNSVRREEQHQAAMKRGGDVNLHGMAIAALNRRVDRLVTRCEKLEAQVFPEAPHVHPRQRGLLS